MLEDRGEPHAHESRFEDASIRDVDVRLSRMEFDAQRVMNTTFGEFLAGEYETFQNFALTIARKAKELSEAAAPITASEHRFLLKYNPELTDVTDDLSVRIDRLTTDLTQLEADLDTLSKNEQTSSLLRPRIANLLHIAEMIATAKESLREASLMGKP